MNSESSEMTEQMSNGSHHISMAGHIMKNMYLYWIGLGSKSKSYAMFKNQSKQIWPS